jgi:hypothetical protein
VSVSGAEAVAEVAAIVPASLKHLIGFRKDRREAVFPFAVYRSLLVHSGHSNRARICPADKSRHRLATRCPLLTQNGYSPRHAKSVKRRIKADDTTGPQVLDFAAGIVVAWDGVVSLRYILAAIDAPAFSVAPAMAFSRTAG